MASTPFDSFATRNNLSEFARFTTHVQKKQVY